MKKQLRYSKGITLVSLVITIILLLILAGISIQAITNTGLFEAAGQAKKEAKRAQVVEWLNLKLIEEQTYNPVGTAEQIIKATKLRVDNNKSELEEIGKTVIVEETKTEEDGEQVDIYFYVQVDKDVFKVELKGAQFIGEAGKFPPIIKLESVTDTTNSITVQVSTKRNEGGKIEYYIKKEDESKYTLKETTTDESYTYTGLEQNKNYSIKIVAIAENKQTAEVTKDVLLGSVPDLTEEDITFTYSVEGQEIDKETWTNKEVTVTVSTTVEGYTLQTSKDKKNWSNETSQTFTENGEIYVALYDGTNYGGSASGNVRNIDTQKPVANISGTTTNSITFTGIDTENTSKNENVSGIAGYIVQESSTEPDVDDTRWTSCDGTSKTVSGLTQGRTYYVFVKDNAGNVSEAVSDETGTVTSGLTTGAITFSTATWNDGRATVTISTNTDYVIQYQKNSVTGEWITGTSVTNLTHNDIVYARLIDTTGQSGNTGTDTSNYASTNIVDGVKPTIGSSVGSTATGNTGTVSVNNIADTGGSGLKGIYISQNSATPTATSVTWTPNTNNQYSTSVSSNGTYNVWVIDNAGNVSNVSTCTVSGIVSKVSNINYSYAIDSITKGDTTSPSLTWSGNPKSINYSVTSGSNYASVNSSTGVVTGTAAGNAIITVTFTNYDNTTVTASKTVKVTYTAYSITNLMANGSFENDITGWYNMPSTWYKDSSRHKFGNYSMRLYCPGQIFPRYNVFETNSHNVYNHYIYAKVSSYVSSDGSGQRPKMYLIFSPSKEGWPSTSSDRTVSGSNTYSTWQDLSVYSKADYSYIILMLCQPESSATGYIHFDGITIVDLTATFGNNIPSKEWCDKHINYFDGTTTIYK